jgi:integral membrane sensor domain MASE1
LARRTAKPPRFFLFVMRLKPVPLIGLNLFLAIVYFAAAELGLSLATLHTNVTPVWPPAGIAIASLLIFGRQLWPGIFAGALAANLLTNIPVLAAVGIAIGNTCWTCRASSRAS